MGIISLVLHHAPKRPIDSSGGKSNLVDLCRIDMFHTAVSESCSAMSRRMNLPKENA